MATDGLTTVQSNFGAKETMDRLEAEVKAKGLTVFARVDHAAGAAEVGMQLRPTELLIFGNARGGTPLMQASQVAGIDLPLKALVYQDAAGKYRHERCSGSGSYLPAVEASLRPGQALGHTVRLMPPAYVKPYVKRQKNDMADALRPFVKRSRGPICGSCQPRPPSNKADWCSIARAICSSASRPQ